jgi:AAA family ATP:ADP antiporter
MFYFPFLQITTVDEAKRFYPLFGLGANVALIFSGRTVKYFSNLRKTLGPGVDGWAISLKAMMSIVVGMGLVICFLYWWVNNYAPLPARSKKKKVVFWLTDRKFLKTVYFLIIFEN